MKRFLFFLLVGLAMAPLFVNAQYFSTGQDPAKIKWRQINTSHFQIIYPEEYEVKAMQVASVFEKVYDFGHRSLAHPPRKISVILHTHTAKSNGLVAWSPRRAELYTTPHQDMYAQDWLEQLAIHEFRHVVQMDKIQQELPAILPLLFGEQAAAVAVGAYLPFWFIEGDAVVTETVFSNSGRGRQASFLMENKAQLLEKGLYSFNKATLGSYKDFVPDRYNFGYWMTGGIREQYGAGIWADVLSEIARRPLSISPVNRVLKKQTGFNQAGLYRNLFQKYNKEWQQELDEKQLSPLVEMTPKNDVFTNYTQAQVTSGGAIAALKSSRDDITRIVRIGQDGKETTITTPGSIFNGSFSAKENLLIWSERRPDVRWAHADRSVVVVYNIDNTVRQEFSFENFIFSPVISPDLNRFAAVEADKTSHYFISVFDLQTGQRIHQFSLPGNNYIFSPCWDEKGKQLFFVMLSSEGKSLASISIENETVKQLTPAGFHEIKNPRFSDGKLFFTGSFTGTDNIYSLHLNDGKIYQQSSVAFGADYVAVSEEQLIFSNFTADGFQLCRLDRTKTAAIPFDSIQPAKYKLAESLASQEDTVLDFTSKSEATFASKPYSKLGHLFNFHSWAPAYVDPDDQEIKPGVSLFSQNKLGTAETRLGYEYDPEEEAGKYKAKFIYSGFFPVFDGEFIYGNRGSDYLLIQNTVDNNGNVIDSDTITKRFEWNELTFDAGINIPLRFSQGKYSQYINPEVSYSYNKISHTSSTPSNFYNGYYHSLTSRLYLQNTISMAELDLAPRWAQVLELVHRQSLAGGSDVGKVSAVQSYLFFPGLLRNHGIKIYNAFQKKESGALFGFGNSVRFPRGYHSYQNTQMYSAGIDYMMPLLYPDLSIGRLIYLKRLRTNLFYDYANLKGNIYSQDGKITGTYSAGLNSVGAEIIGDGHFLRLVSPVSAGFRGAYLPDLKSFQFQFLLSLDFGSI